MVHIYTFCDKTLVGKSENTSAKFLCENLYNSNMKIEDVCIFCNSYDYESINFKNGDIYFLLMQKSNATLNSYLARLSNCELTENSLLKETINNYYKALNVPMESAISLEWTIPSSAIAITNPSNKTQGYYVKVGNGYIFVLPNYFEEFKKIYFVCLLNHFENNFNIEYKSETFKVFGLTEELIKTILKEKIRNKDKVYISVFSSGLDNDVVIKAKTDNALFNDYRQDVFNILEKYIYSVHDLSLSEHLSKRLAETKSSIAFVGDESLVLALSNVNIDSIKNYIKVCEIYPKNDNLELEGISPEKVYDMAVNTLKKADTELVVASIVKYNNNIATAFIAIGNKAKIDIYKNTFMGDKKEVYNNIADTVLFYLNKKLIMFDYKTV